MATRDSHTHITREVNKMNASRLIPLAVKEQRRQEIHSHTHITRELNTMKTPRLIPLAVRENDFQTLNQIFRT